MTKEVIWEAIKEPLRLFVLAIIPFAISYFGGLNTEWAIMLTVFLRFVDKLLHLYGKELEAEGTLKKPVSSVYTAGLTRF